MPWLGWRWCFFVGVPIAVLAFVVLQRTLKLRDRPAADVKIDYLGAGLIAAGRQRPADLGVVRRQLVRLAVVADRGAWSARGVVVLGARRLRSRCGCGNPSCRCKIVVQRTPALAIIASLAVGMAMFGGAVFLGQYFQVGRGYIADRGRPADDPDDGRGLLSSTVAGRHDQPAPGRSSRTSWPAPSILVLGFLGLGMVDHDTSLWCVGLAMAVVGIGVGMTMQNLVLAVQNTVPLRDLGAASASVTFFRSLGGTIGVSVLGAVLANRVTADLAADAARAGGPRRRRARRQRAEPAALPPEVQAVVQTVYGDATAHIFLISVAVAVVGVIAALLLKPITLRTTIDLEKKDDTDPVVSDPIVG